MTGCCSNSFGCIIRFMIFLVFAFVFLYGCTSVNPYVPSHFGETRGRAYPHTGNDYNVNWGTPVLAVSGGKVI